MLLRFNETLVKLTAEQNSVEVRAFTGNGIYSTVKTVLDDIMGDPTNSDLQVTVLDMISSRDWDGVSPGEMPAAFEVIVVDHADAVEGLVHNRKKGFGKSLFLLYESPVNLRDELLASAQLTVDGAHLDIIFARHAVIVTTEGIAFDLSIWTTDEELARVLLHEIARINFPNIELVPNTTDEEFAESTSF